MTFVYLAIIAYGRLYSNSDVNNIGYLIGFSLAIAVIILAIFHLMFRQDQSRS